MALFYDPASSRDPEREDRLRSTAARIEIRPAERAAWLGVRSLACPECGVPIRIDRPIGWSDPIACAFCETEGRTRDFVQDQGYPAVDLIARLG